jgi:uncharacterized protein involved in response to NO
MSPRPSSSAAGSEPAPASGRTVPLLALGFRPFFLLAALFAVAAVPLWLLALLGVVTPGGHMHALAWHRHEMIFGYTLAVIAGFLLTAARNWTARPMPSGGRLLALALLWLAARVLQWTGGVVPWLVALVDVAFPLALAAVLLPPLWATRQFRNLGFVPMLALFALASLAAHLDALGIGPIDAARAHRLALDLILFLIVVMGGRVIPAFTRNALPAAGVRRLEAAEWPAILFVAAVLLLGVAGAPPRWQAAAAALAALANAARMAPWGARHTLLHPILWILHLGYAWIPLGLALQALAALGLIAPSVATHSLTIGAVGSLTLGMMARVALGHTGRPLAVARPTTVAFVLVNLAALARLSALLTPDLHLESLLAAGALWSLAFLLFLWVHLPILTRARLDGRAG